MIQTKFALFECLCDPQFNFLESFEKILIEISKMNINKKKPNEDGLMQTIEPRTQESELNRYEKLEINIINIIINILFNIPCKQLILLNYLTLNTN